jgi:hypothetical protein
MMSAACNFDVSGFCNFSVAFALRIEINIEARNEDLLVLGIQFSIVCLL